MEKRIYQNSSGVKVTKLININIENKKNIYNFYEFIMIMLKLKYYDYILSKLSNKDTNFIHTTGGSIQRRFLGNTNYANHSIIHNIHNISHKLLNSNSNKKNSKKNSKKSTKITKKNYKK